jgi:hypothetical protein
MRRLLLLACILIPTWPAVARSDEGVEFFEKKVRPVLAEHCYRCHSSEPGKKQRGGLALDTKAGVRSGGDRGPAVVPGKPGASLLLKAVRHADPDLKMPPDLKLPAAVIADLETWIAAGAPDPRVAKVKGYDFAEARRHWAFQPLASVAPPAVKNEAWVASPLDRFILAKLEAAGLTPSPPADRRTLLRRVYYDLIGLPPTAEEVEGFVNDASPKAYAKVVDRLLASPRYGERWGRHWLDVARYADTKDGVLMYGDARIRPYAYTYRDYVIRAFNDDTPFDRFIAEQLAADRIEPKVEPWRLAAMGFLTLGRMFDNNLHDVIDDRIDTVTRGFLGLTVACARCHDHKYDPIPTADYYSLYGVFASCEAPLELPLIDATEKPTAAEFEKKAAPKRREIRTMADAQFALLSEQARRRVGDYLVRAATTEPDPLETAIFFLSLAPDDLRPQIVHRWRRYLAHPDRATDPVFGPWQEYMKLPAADFARRATAVAERWRARPVGTAPGQVNPLVHEALGGAKLASRADVAKLYGALIVRAYDESKKQTSLPAERRQLAELVAGRESPCYFPKSQTYYYMSRGEKDRYGGLLSEIDRLAVKSPDAPARAMVLVDSAEVYDPRVFHRGNPAAPTDRVPRRFLQVLSPEQRDPFAHGGGRLDLARAIADHPLTARVFVNRVWMHHFGEPLVSTPSDFGARSTPPTHPALLDWLAGTFKKDRWSLKKLHRLIVLSSTYRQASADRPACRAADAENKLLWRSHRRRLDFEAMRDTLLAVSGRLDLTMGGRPVDVANDPTNHRRTVYGLVDRQSLPGLFRAFDFASPDQSAERRPMTTVPQQALFGLNAPFVVEQAKALAARSEGMRSPEQRVVALYRLVMGRNPDPDEVRAGVQFVGVTPSGSQLTPWQQYAQVLLLTNEAMFID